MIRARNVVALVLGLVATSLSGGCEEDRQTAVLLIIDYGADGVGPVDQFVIQAYPADRFDDIGVQEIPETAGAPLTGDSVSVLLVLPERWADRNVIVSVVALLGGEGVGQGSGMRAFAKGKVTEFEIVLKPGAPACGNAILEALEQCDGTVIGGNTCQNTMGLRDGTVSCTNDCLLDVSGCYECGNSAIEAAEECDSDDFGGINCADYFFDGGSLRCDPDSCTILTDECIGGCGNDLAEPGEACDGTDFGARTCLTEIGHFSGSLICDASCELDRSGCHTCGNGAIEGPEACDGDEFGGETCESLLGMPGSLACAQDCSFIYTAGCSGCGNGLVVAPEECDDGNLVAGDGCQPDCTEQPGWICVGEPSQCGPDTCGDGVIDAGEACDGANLDGETCFTRGYRPGSGALTCSAVCTSFDTTTCIGGIINSTAQLQAAVNEAYDTGAHQEIAIPSSTFTLTGSIVFDECGVSCVGGQPYGVTIRPFTGLTTCFTPAGVFEAFDVVTGNNIFTDLCFTEATAAIRLQNGPDAGGNTVIRNLFDNSVTAPGQLIEVGSDTNLIVANRFVNANAAGITALIVSEDGNTVAMNVFSGYYDWAVMLHTFPATIDQRTYFDHNSIHIIGGGGGIFLNGAEDLCYRNNIIYGDGTTTGIYLGGDVLIGSQADCDGVSAEANVNANHATLCDQLGCAIYCNGSVPTANLCDLTTAPGWSPPELCLAGGNPLINAAVQTSRGYDFNDATPAIDYIGSGPDIGAREAGTDRSYGGFSSSCP